ncbi:hypothetical protein DTO013E5_7551 [Penicillium roqueforti]|uniref:Transmembrane protein n=1 Tax=Penicillium roqueforti (strain FM164) TaxID=1365484 RepID=W6QKJ8_PENRF|nr:uncharacterized protein LCP9604111_8088 [Penicillium roqueforti]XP_057038231.1 uncharacterized protein N7518_009649 [Penicillium psychrosexuale]CDM37328.1 unnamed protein product [Penicillium roqueforti FM164]KAF9242180.1 hypothetical protein LCP9604111_8088 [Penicillium roqueforti]KAI1833345.1 hypothetical protein CBS147337_5843 [Penicillium roqueforti]KAI2671862.1 hypothetical protein CBS147355_8505 [Penicillium roqueforti]KAI2675220.1 hypothetical protein LCP963914a_8623 [Penicillium ro
MLSQFALPGANKPYGNPTRTTFKPRNGRLLIPFMATIGLGFGAYNYYVAAKLRREQALLEEEQRLARNQQLMDAYGDKNSLHELQHALDTYSR